MKKLFLSILLIVPLAAQAALFGPSGTDNDCTSRASFAWCIMDLGKKSDGLDDAKPGTIPVGYAAPGFVSKTVDGIGIASQAAMGVGDVLKVSNVSLLGTFGGAMNLLSVARDLGRRDPASLIHTIAIRPEGETEPYSLFVASLIDALTKLTGAEKAEYSAEFYPELFASKRRGHFRLIGGELCTTHDCRAAIAVDKYVCKAHNETIPLWLSESKPSTVIRCTATIFLAVDGKMLNHDTVIYGLNKYLPDTVFVYLPPSPVKPMATVITKDKEFFFIRPERKE